MERLFVEVERDGEIEVRRGDLGSNVVVDGILEFL